MTVSSQNYRNQYTSTGATGYDFTFKILDEDHLNVYQTDGTTAVETLLTITTDYTVAGVGENDGGRVSLVSAPAAGDLITLVMNVPYTQETDWKRAGPMDPEILENDLDKIVLRDLQMKEVLDRCLKISVGSDSAATADELMADINAAALAAQAAQTAAEAAQTAAEAAETNAEAARDEALAAILRFDCYLQYTTASAISLAVRNGNKIWINGANRTNAGVSVGTAGLAANTTYYVYAYWTGAAVALELSATAPAVDATFGHKIKTGDGTRTLVGMARTNAATQFTEFLVSSYYNRVPRRQGAVFTTDRATTSATLAEINSEIRNGFLSWGDSVLVFLSGKFQLSVTSQIGTAAVTLDGVATVISRVSSAVPYNGADFSVGSAGSFKPAEGYHYITVAGSASGGATITFIAANTVLSVEVMG